MIAIATRSRGSGSHAPLQSWQCGHTNHPFWKVNGPFPHGPLGPHAGSSSTAAVLGCGCRLSCQTSQVGEVAGLSLCSWRFMGPGEHGNRIYVQSSRSTSCKGYSTEVQYIYTSVHHDKYCSVRGTVQKYNAFLSWFDVLKPGNSPRHVVFPCSYADQSIPPLYRAPFKSSAVPSPTYRYFVLPLSKKVSL